MNIQRTAPLRGDGFWIGKGGLESGMYEEAAKRGQSFSMLLEDIRAEKQQPTIYRGLTKTEIFALRKELKAQGKEIPLTAFEECLKFAGIQAYGTHTDVVGKFFEYSDVDVLFPEFIADRVYAGMLKSSIVPEFVMAETVISSTNFHKIYIEDTEADRQLGEVGKGEEFGETKIVVSKESIYLTKFGRYLTVAYEDVEYQRLNVFGRALERIGLQIEIDRSDDMVSTLINGDGNSNTPGTTVESDSSGTIGTADVIEWATCLPTPYKMDKHLGKKALLVKYYTALADFENPIATWGFMGINLPKTFEWDRSVLTSDYLLGVDSRYAIEHITTGAVLTETEKVIRKQLHGTAISHRDAFAIFDENAVAIFDETHA